MLANVSVQNTVIHPLKRVVRRIIVRHRIVRKALRHHRVVRRQVGGQDTGRQAGNLEGRDRRVLDIEGEAGGGTEMQEAREHVLRRDAVAVGLEEKAIH